MSTWQYEGSALEDADRLQRRREMGGALSYVRAAAMDLDRRAWREAATIILGGTERPQAVTYALIAWRGHLMGGHPVLGLLEAYREYLLGERTALTDEELAPLRERAA